MHRLKSQDIFIQFLTWSPHWSYVYLSLTVVFIYLLSLGWNTYYISALQALILHQWEVEFVSDAHHRWDLNCAREWWAHRTSLIQWKLIPANRGASAGHTLLGARDTYPGREEDMHFPGRSWSSSGSCLPVGMLSVERFSETGDRGNSSAGDDSSRYVSPPAHPQWQSPPGNNFESIACCENKAHSDWGEERVSFFL